MDTVLYPVCAVVGWVASGYMLRLQRRQPSRPRRAICVALTAFATGITLAIPPIGAAIEDLTRLPNLARLLSHACVMVISTSAETMLLFLALPEAQARRSIRRWIRVTSSAFVVMVALFGYTLTYHPPVRLTVEYARVPAVTLYLLIFMAIGFFGYCVDIARLCWRFARMCGRPWLRRGLRLTAVGALFALAYSTNKIIFLIAYWLGAHPAGERDIAAVLVTIAALLMVTGLTMPAWGPALAITRRWASLRAHRRLAPLWYDLIAEFPELELDPSLRRTLPAIRDIDYTLTRRVAEIRDAQMALRPYVDRRVTALATRLAGEAGLSDDDRQAVVEAAQLAAAIQAHRAGHEAREPQPTVDLHRPTGGFRGEVAWLARVADAYRGSSIVDRGQRMTKDRYANLARIRTLDPPADYLAIYQTMMRYEFPWDMKLGLNLAFNRSFSVPRIAALHTSTGELTERTQKRIDDTGLLMYEMVLNGLEHPRGLRSLRRVNQIHRAYDIPNDDYLYVLGCLVVIPTRWLERYGWRRPCCHERGPCPRLSPDPLQHRRLFRARSQLPVLPRNGPADGYPRHPGVLRDAGGVVRHVRRGATGTRRRRGGHRARDPYAAAHAHTEAPRPARQRIGQRDVRRAAAPSGAGGEAGVAGTRGPAPRPADPGGPPPPVRQATRYRALRRRHQDQHLPRRVRHRRPRPAAAGGGPLRTGLDGAAPARCYIRVTHLRSPGGTASRT